MAATELAARASHRLAGFDEAFAEPGVARAHYGALLAQLGELDLAVLRGDVDDDVGLRGLSFGCDGQFAIDPVPRLLTAEEWSGLAAGLSQRARALNAFVADVYGERAIVAAGVIPGRVIERADHFDPELVGLDPVGGSWIGVAAMDVVRQPDGSFLVLEDNLRTPSGFSYASAARDVVVQRLATQSVPPPRGIVPTPFQLLAETLRAAAPDGRGDPAIVVLSDGPSNGAYYEHREVASRLAVPLVTLADLELRRGRLRAWLHDGGTAPVDVVYRRTDEDRVRHPDGRLTAIAQMLLEPCRRGRLACVNAFGTGVADDKLVHAHVEEMTRFYLHEEPLVRSVAALDLCAPGVLATTLDRLDTLVVKPRSGHGGAGVVVCAHADAADRERAARAIAAHPERYIAQSMVTLSHHPTVIGGELAPRHVDLRPFVFTAGDRVTALCGGLTRYARDAGALVVNSSQGGGGKDTWVLQ